MTAQRETARTREAIFATQCWRRMRWRRFIFLEQFAEAFFEALGVEVAFDDAAVADRDDSGFFADNDDYGIGFFCEAEGRAVAGAEGAVDVDALADGEDAGGGEDSAIAEDEATVVEGGFGEEDADGEFRGEFAVDADAGFGEGFELCVAFDGEEGTELAVGEFEGGFCEDFDGFAALRAPGEEAVTAEGCKCAAEFGLEDHHQSECQESDEVAKEPADFREVKDFGEEGDEEQYNGEASEDFRARGAAEKEP